MKPLSKHICFEIYSLLVDIGADIYLYDHFELKFSQKADMILTFPLHTKLGFGAKFWKCGYKLFVTYLSDNITYERHILQSNINKKLLEISNKISIDYDKRCYYTESLQFPCITCGVSRTFRHKASYWQSYVLNRSCKSCTQRIVLPKHDPVDLIRNCPLCDKSIKYSKMTSKMTATKNNSKCRSCATKSLIRTDEWNNNISKSVRGVPKSDIHREKLRKHLIYARNSRHTTVIPESSESDV